MSGNRNSKLVPVTFIFLSFIFPIAVVIALGMVIDRKSRNRRLRGCFQSIRHILTSTDETQDIPKRSDGRTMGTPVAVATIGKTRRQTTHR